MAHHSLQFAPGQPYVLKSLNFGMSVPRIMNLQDPTYTFGWALGSVDAAFLVLSKHMNNTFENLLCIPWLLPFWGHLYFLITLSVRVITIQTVNLQSCAVRRHRGTDLGISPSPKVPPLVVSTFFSPVLEYATNQLKRRVKIAYIHTFDFLRQQASRWCHFPQRQYLLR